MNLRLSKSLFIIVVPHVHHRQHSCAASVKADRSSWAKRPTYYPCYTHSFWALDMKLGAGDNVRPRTNPAKFGPFGISGRALARGWNIRVVWLFFVLDSATDPTKSARSTQNGSKDAELRKVVLFGGYNFQPLRFWGVLTHRPPNLGSEEGFPCKWKYWISRKQYQISP